LKKDFYLLLKEAKEIEPTEKNNSELKEYFLTILEKLDTIKIPKESITVENKGLLIELKKLKDEIVFEIQNNFSERNSYNENSFNEKNSYSENKKEHSENNKRSKFAKSGFASNNQPIGCPQCQLDYGNCECPKIVEEKIDRKILFDYAKNDERSPLHETYSYENNFNER
jgi:hypothetical protein